MPDAGQPTQARQVRETVGVVVSTSVVTGVYYVLFTLIQPAAATHPVVVGLLMVLRLWCIVVIGIGCLVLVVFTGILIRECVQQILHQQTAEEAVDEPPR